MWPGRFSASLRELWTGAGGTSPSSTSVRTPLSSGSVSTGPGGFIVGHGIDVGVLEAAGIQEADAVVVATNGDNTNLVIGQVAQKRFDIQCVVVRILDPARAEFYATPRAADGVRRHRPRSRC